MRWGCRRSATSRWMRPSTATRRSSELNSWGVDARSFAWGLQGVWMELLHGGSMTEHCGAHRRNGEEQRVCSTRAPGRAAHTSVCSFLQPCGAPAGHCGWQVPASLGPHPPVLLSATPPSPSNQGSPQGCGGRQARPHRVHSPGLPAGRPAGGPGQRRALFGRSAGGGGGGRRAQPHGLPPADGAHAPGRGW